MKMELEYRPAINGDRFYSKNDKQADLMLALMGRKSFTREQVQLIKSMGWEVICTSPKINI